MSAKQNPAANDAGAESEETIGDHLLRTPDQDGPHDVPDDEVIEKTLPSVPIR